ncbi:uncharacterized protein LOC128191792 isoform X2 [Crassostrea angulata]|uniref:uncharacterized protein LOC128191792 isoform X2 n=1 Tax=Magallana angulata TaxID=2784310 RepID=UPI0022B09E26|nr:uncharacterized protein LOC128191792 isoform X2 [Crassostrea angulata]
MRHLIFVLAISSIQNHFEHAQLVDQEFLHIDLHPKDGFLDMNEFTTFFNVLDTDRNRKLTYAEFADPDIDNLVQHWLFSYYDTNKDGSLTKVEFVDNNFSAMDINGDKLVTKNEFANYYSNLIQHLQQHGR